MQVGPSILLREIPPDGIRLILQSTNQPHDIPGKRLLSKAEAALLAFGLLLELGHTTDNQILDSFHWAEKFLQQ